MDIHNENGILYRRWEATAPERGVFLLIHGLGGHSGRWHHWAKFFASAGFSSYAIELAGFGETDGPAGHVDSFELYYRDLSRLLGLIRSEHPAAMVFVCGESMGALLACVFSRRYPFSGLICVSPALKSRIRISLRQRLAFVWALFFNRRARFDMAFTTAMCTRDLECRQLLDADSREHRMASAALLWNILGSARSCRAMRSLSIPVLFLIAGRDSVVDTDVSRKTFEKLDAPRKKMIEYPDMYHALTIDAGRERVFGDVLNWLTQVREQEAV